MERPTPEQVKSVEKFVEEPLFKLLLVRHEEIKYDTSDPSVTPEGLLDAEELGKDMNQEYDLENVEKPYLLHSPQPRTKQTLEAIAKGANLPEDVKMRSINQLRTADKGPNYQEFMDAGTKVMDEEGGLNDKSWDRITAAQYGNDPLYTSRPDVVETKEHRAERLYRSLEYLIRWTKRRKVDGNVQQVIAVSHFEIIMHVIDDVFGIENFPTHNLPAFGDHLAIQAFSTENPNAIKLKVEFKGQMKEVIFDREDRSIKHLKEHA